MHNPRTYHIPRNIYTPTGFVDSKNKTGQIKNGEWRKYYPDDGLCLKNINNVRGSRLSIASTKMRDALKEYVNSDVGSVEWQLKYVRSTGNE